LMVLTKRSARAYKFGELGGNFTVLTPLASMIFENSSVNRGSLRKGPRKGWRIKVVDRLPRLFE